MYRKILIANDGSEGAAKALAAAIDVAKRYRAELHMLSVEEIQRLPGTREEVIGEKELQDRRFADVTRKSQEQAKHHRVRLATHVIAGHAVPSIVDFVHAGGFDLLVVGFMGHSALYNRLIGSTTDRLVDLAPCTVLVVK